jgi:hypothetical protein
MAFGGCWRARRCSVGREEDWKFSEIAPTMLRVPNPPAPPLIVDDDRRAAPWSIAPAARSGPSLANTQSAGDVSRRETSFR